MKTLSLMRHGKSSWSDPTLGDRDRPLNARGERDVPVIAQRLQKLGVRPSLIVASSAKRTWQTAKLVAVTIGYPREFIHRESDLYLADPTTIASTVEQQEDGFNSILICLHNPGITQITNRLVAGLTANIPTSGCLVTQSECSTWREFFASDPEFVAYEYPKKHG